MNLTKTVLFLTASGLALAACGCSSDSGTGTAIGAGTGAVAGGVIGNVAAGKGNRTGGTAIGAGAGALIGGGTGYLFGREGDKKKEAERAAQDRNYQTAPPASPAVTPPPGNYAQPQATYTPPAGAAPMQAITKQDVITWTQQGTQEAIIVDRVQRSGTRMTLTAADETQLRDAGVRDSVIRALKGGQ